MASDLPNTDVAPASSPQLESKPIADAVSKQAPLNASVGPQWLHPMSPFFDAIAKIYSMLIPILLGGYAALNGAAFGYLFAFLVVILNLMVALIKYLGIRYELQGNDLIVDEGILFRNHRTIPVQRIQNIDLKQNVLHRLCKVAEVRIETASGDKPEAILRVLSLEQIEWLRGRIAELQKAKAPIAAQPAAPKTAEISTEQTTDVAPAQTVPAEVVLELPLKLLLLAGLLSNRGLVMVGIVFGLLFQDNWWEEKSFLRKLVKSIRESKIIDGDLDRVMLVLIAIGIVILGIVAVKILSMAWYVLRFYGYRMERAGNELQIRCGLFTQMSATIPRNRIQLVSIQRSFLERKWGLATIRIETAGSTKDSNDATTSIGRRWFVPVMAADKLPEVMEQLRPSVTWRESDFQWQPLSPLAGQRMRRFGLFVSILLTIVAGIAFRPWGFLIGIIAIPACIWYANKKARSMRYARRENQVAYRSGVLVRKFTFSFFDKIQTVAIKQSPFDRRWKMGTLAVDTAAAGPANHRIVVKMLDQELAEQEFIRLSQYASNQTLSTSS